LFGELVRGALDYLEVRLDTAARVDEEENVERHAVAREERDLLRDAVFREREVGRAKARDGASLRVPHRDGHEDEVARELDFVVLLSRPCSVTRVP
jgi:hypothetical protein